MPTALLGHGLALAASAEPTERMASAAAAADPLRLDLPPLPGAQVAPELLRALSALYLAARVEETGLVQVAELLVRERATLRVPVSTGARLEDLARRWPASPARDERLTLYARLFGLGPRAHVDPTGGGARFEPLLAGLCSAIVTRAQRAARERRGALGQAAGDLATIAGRTGGGAAVLSVPRINDRLRDAVALVSDPGICALVGAGDVWDALRRFLHPTVPDVRRLLDCGRGGQHVLMWLASVAPLIAADQAARIDAGPDAARAASTWLLANGLAAPKAGLV